MYEILDVLWQRGTVTVDIQLWHIWIFLFLVSAMIFVNWKRAITVFTLLTAIMVGWQESMAAVQETIASTPAMWMTYLFVGTFMLAALAHSFAMEE